MPQPQRNVSIFSGIARRLFEGHLVECDLAFAASADIFEGDALMPQMELREFIHPVIMAASVKIKTHHHRVVDGADADPATLKHVQIIFDIMPNFKHRWVFKQRL